MHIAWWLPLSIALHACQSLQSPEDTEPAERAVFPHIAAVSRPAGAGRTVEIVRSAHASNSFCLVTHYSRNQADYAEMAAATHRAYAQRHGYVSHAYLERLSGEQFRDPQRGDEESLWGGGLFWQKIAAVQRALQQGLPADEGEPVRCAWVMWLDSDAVITNPLLRLEDLVRAVSPAGQPLALLPAAWARAEHDDRPHAPKWPHVWPSPVLSIDGTPQWFAKDVILSAEQDHPINAGVFLIRNSPGGRAYMEAVAALYPLYKDNSLPEQTAMATVAYLVEPWPSNTAVAGLHVEPHPNIAVVPQRAMNSFYGEYGRWPEPVQWQPGDFIGHLAGTPHPERAAAIERLLDHSDAYLAGDL